MPLKFILNLGRLAVSWGNVSCLHCCSYHQTDFHHPHSCFISVPFEESTLLFAVIFYADLRINWKFYQELSEMPSDIETNNNTISFDFFLQYNRVFNLHVSLSNLCFFFHNLSDLIWLYKPYLFIFWSFHCCVFSTVPQDHTCYLYLFLNILYYLSHFVWIPPSSLLIPRLFPSRIFLLPSAGQIPESTLKGSSQARRVTGKPWVCSSDTDAHAWAGVESQGRDSAKSILPFLKYLLWAPWTMRSRSSTPIHFMKVVLFHFP